MEFKNKVACITGASVGIGRACGRIINVASVAGVYGNAKIVPCK